MIVEPNAIVPEALHKKVSWDMRHHFMAEKVVDRFGLKLPRDRCRRNKAAHSRSVTFLPHLFLGEVEEPKKGEGGLRTEGSLPRVSRQCANGCQRTGGVK
jgi:hypothetical protein